MPTQCAMCIAETKCIIHEAVLVKRCLNKCIHCSGFAAVRGRFASPKVYDMRVDKVVARDSVALTYKGVTGTCKP